MRVGQFSESDARLTHLGCRFIVRGIARGHLVGGIYLIS